MQEAASTTPELHGRSYADTPFPEQLPQRYPFLSAYLVFRARLHLVLLRARTPAALNCGRGPLFERGCVKRNEVL